MISAADKNAKQFPVRLGPELAGRLDNCAANTGSTKSNIVRAAVKDYLDRGGY